MTEYRHTNPPDDLDPKIRDVAQKLRESADHMAPDPTFTARLEHRLASAYPSSEARSMFTLNKIAPTLLWIMAAAVMILAVDWLLRSLAPQPSPAAHNTPVPTQAAPLESTAQPTSPALLQSYNWRGTTLSVGVALPEGPAEVGIYEGQLDARATLDDVTALARRFGIEGRVYQAQGDMPGTISYLVTDGKQRLQVQSAGYVDYTADMSKTYNNFEAVQKPDAEQVIGDFLQSHGYTFPHRIEWSDFRGLYVVQPLAPNGLPLRYEFYSQPMMLVTLDEDGTVLGLHTSLINVAPQTAGQVGIISAQEALQRLLDVNRTNGIIESVHAAPQQIKQWKRSFPLDQTLTYYGYINTAASAEPGQPPFIQINGYPATGNTAGLEQLRSTPYVAATGRFVSENGGTWFSIDSWELSPYPEGSLVGTIQRQDGHTIMSTEDGKQVILPDVPTDVLMPFENAFVVGTQTGDTFEWSLIDNRALGGGGGGGGGGSGFYKLNLSGTPVPFPTATPAAADEPGAAGGAQYTVQQGDTLSKIAAEHGTDAQTLMQLNDMTDPGKLQVGQVLELPGSAPRRVDGLRGILSITTTKQSDGSQSVAYGFIPTMPGSPGGYVLLQGSGLEKLQNYNSRPVDVWGTLQSAGDGTIGTLHVERFEIPFPDLQVRVLQGKQRVAQIDGMPATLFIAEDGQTYVQLLQDGTTGESLTGKEGDEVLVECIRVPGETLGGYPALRIFGSMLAIDPKSGLHTTLPITMDKPIVLETPDVGKPSGPLSATIDDIELELYTSDPRYAAEGPHYFQPVWRFSGHYSSGDAFEVLIQATRQEFLLPEMEQYRQGG